jgi:hypothetical protein
VVSVGYWRWHSGERLGNLYSKPGSSSPRRAARRLGPLAEGEIRKRGPRVRPLARLLRAWPFMSAQAKRMNFSGEPNPIAGLSLPGAWSRTMAGANQTQEDSATERSTWNTPFRHSAPQQCFTWNHEAASHGFPTDLTSQDPQFSTVITLERGCFFSRSRRLETFALQSVASTF